MVTPYAGSDRKCLRHPKHAEAECPHHGSAVEMDCYCFLPTRAHLDVIRQRGSRTWETQIHIDGVVFVLTTASSPEKAPAIQAAAVRLKMATEVIGARWL